MQNYFEKAAIALIVVDPYSRTRHTSTKIPAQISAIDFNSGRGETGVDLRWHTPKEFMQLEREQRDKPVSWQKTPDGRSVLSKSIKDKDKNSHKGGKRKSNGKDDNPKQYKKWLKSYVKKSGGLKHVMSLLAKEEVNNVAFVASLNAQAVLPHGPTVAPIADPVASAVSGALISVKFPAGSSTAQS